MVCIIKLLIGGSPCTHWSIAQTKNRETKPEGLGWELFLNYKIALEKYKPDYFLYENNKSMSPAIKAQITRELGMEPIMINSALVSAQNRQRLYWVGKREPDGTYSTVPVEQPEDRGILLRDILETGVSWKEKAYCLRASAGEHSGTSNLIRNIESNGKFGYLGVAEPVNTSGDEKSHTLKAQYYKNGLANFITNGGFPATAVAEPIRIGTIESAARNAEFDSQQYRVYSPDGKSVTLCGQGGGVEAKTGLYATPVRVGTYPSPDGTLGNSQGRRIYMVDGKTPSLLASQTGGNSDTSSPSTRLYAVPADCDVVVTDNSIRCQRRDKKHSTVQGTHVNFESGKTQTLSPSHTPEVLEPVSHTQVIEANYDVINGADILVANGKIRQGDCRGSKQGKYVYTELTEKSNVVSAGQAHNEKVLVPKPDGKWKTIYEVRDGQITIKGRQYPIKLADGFYIIRKLTVKECMRLQTVPEWYVFPVSDTQCYKMLGNGWTCDVIAHIMSYMDGITIQPVEVLSMYDGMSCGHIALDKLGANVVRYYATEIDRYAIKTTMANYPDTIQLGDAFQVRDNNWSV